MRCRYWLLPLVLIILAGPAIRPGPSAASSAPQLISQLRVVHMVPGAVAVDVLMDGARIATGLTYGAATPYLTLPAGTREFSLAPSGAAVASALVRLQLPLAPGQPYTLLGIGTPPQPLLLQDERFVPVGGPPRIRFVQASAGTSPLDLVVAGGPPLFSSVSFGEATGYVDLPPGTESLVLREAGATTDLLVLQDVVLTVGTVYTLVAATGLVGGAPVVGVVALVDS